jgi:hypothetical protein
VQVQIVAGIQAQARLRRAFRGCDILAKHPLQVGAMRECAGVALLYGMFR